MPIPAGIDPAYVALLLWLVIELALLTMISQLPGDAEIAEEASRRTYVRLGRLNGYIDNLVSDRWPSNDLVGDVSDLHALRREVDWAATPDRRSRRRAWCIGWARLVALGEIVAVALVLLAYWFHIMTAILMPLSSVLFAIGLATLILLVAVGEALSQSIRTSEDG